MTCRIHRIVKCMMCFMVGVCIMWSVGCGNANEASTNRMKGVESAMEYMAVDIQTLQNQELMDWVEANCKEQGMYTMEHDEYLYIMVAAGEKPTGGYVLNIDQLLETEDTIEVQVTTISPKKGDVVSQGFSYPHQLIRIKEEARKIVLEMH